MARAAVLSRLRAFALRRLVPFGLALVASAAFVVIARMIGRPAFDRNDAWFELFVHHHLDSPAGDAWAQAASFLGSNVVLLPVVATVIALAVARKRGGAAIVLALDTVVVIGAETLLKVAFQRERPRLFDTIALPTDYSFPSGHSMSAVGVWGVVAVVLIALYPRARRAIVVAAIVLIASIGLSRVYLGVHWPFDVLGGWLGGIPPLVASIHLIHSRSRDAEPPRGGRARVHSERRGPPGAPPRLRS